MDARSIVGLTLLLCSVIVTMVLLISQKEPFFNVRDIVKKHWTMFEKSKIHRVYIFGVPILFSVGLSLLYGAGTAFYSELSILLGILLSILLAVLTVIGVLDFSKVLDRKQKEKSKTVLSQTVNAIFFTSILCVFLLLYGLAVIVISGATIPCLAGCRDIIKRVVAGIAYYVFLVILFNILIIIKQLCKLIEFNQESKKE